MSIKPSLSWLIFFLLGAALFGFVFLIPPLQKPDEEVHFYRTLSLAQGSVFCRTSTGNAVKLNASTAYLINHIHAMDLPLHKGNKFDFSVYGNTLQTSDKTRVAENYSVDYQCSYPLISYIPQVAGILFGTLFTHNGLVLFFLGRAAMAITAFIWILLIYRKIRHELRPLLITVVFTPVLLQQVTAFSYDSVHILLALTCFVFVVNRSTNIIGLLITVLLLLISKPGGYEFFALLFFALPLGVPSGTRKSYIVKAVLFFGFLGFLYAISKVSLLTAYGGGERLRTDISPVTNVLAAVDNPFGLASLIIVTTVKRMVFYIQSTAGILGWLEYSVGLFGYMAYGALAGYVLLITTSHVYTTYSKRVAVVASVMVAASYVLLLIMFFVLWTPPGAPYIDGVQGRYFLPLLPFVYFLIAYARKKLYSRDLLRLNTALMGSLLIFVTVATLGAVFVRYY